MGASLETPARCHLCKVESSEPVTLKCKHRFCRRCIEDLWSPVPNGPYRCPEWRCKMVYQTLPFDRTLIPQRASSGSRGVQTRSTAGTIEVNAAANNLISPMNYAGACFHPHILSFYSRSNTRSPQRRLRFLGNDNETNVNPFQLWGFFLDKYLVEENVLRCVYPCILCIRFLLY